ncbi:MULTISPECIES: competence type IV pilus minor pilin ComGF [Cytobacillus]|uniref:competence type IV pilus minor pilin ComGF n=1 Tax=Cytobacillus TaxID=2675230 RepID=UPI00203CC071|nr:competence type IV pilus minor pilin ComGF [Cytobacillus kochii]MCM3320611.1 prepilin-type N-terminal cleavage/methylation domain-containing protein [Cytobacillus kochii]MCM3344555.1 prepilin-type N-terminal cleavage/methylation domain-containing protein [Cytobacillus kochii]MDM5208398.1 competence type IV pilus minor pilin ComGF [Cytobacillus kochii]
MKSIKRNGFTLIEALITLACFLIIVSFMPLVFKVISVNENIDERKQKIEWLVFIQQLKKEVRVAEKISLDNRGVLILLIDNQSISYEKYGDKLRRRVNGAGHEVVLQKLQSVQFEVKEDNMVLIYKNIFQKEYRSSFYQMKIRRTNGDEENE